MLLDSSMVRVLARFVMATGFESRSGHMLFFLPCNILTMCHYFDNVLV